MDIDPDRIARSPFAVGAIGALITAVKFTPGATWPERAINVASAAPYIAFSETDQGTDLKNWLFVVDGTHFQFQTKTDAGAFIATVMYLDRSGNMTLTGAVTDGSGNQLGYLGIPSHAKSAAYTVTSADRGCSIDMANAYTVTVNNGVFNAGDTFMVCNISGSNMTIAQGGTATLRLAGTTATGNRTLLPFGVATLRCVGGDSFLVSGNVT